MSATTRSGDQTDEADQAGQQPSTGFGLTRSYDRLPQVEAEIRALPSVEDPGFRKAVEGTASVEAVVHAMRRLIRAGRQEEARALGDVLMARADKMLANEAIGRFPRDRARREELLERLTERVIRKVYDLSPTNEFWEVHFQDALIKESYSFARSMTTGQAGHEANTVSLDAVRDDGRREVAEPAAPGDLAEDILAALEHDEGLREAFSKLDPQVALALRLKLEGYQDKSKDPDELTISRILGKTDRTLRNYWIEVRTVLGPWLEARGATPRGAASA